MLQKEFSLIMQNRAVVPKLNELESLLSDVRSFTSGTVLHDDATAIFLQG